MKNLALAYWLDHCAKFIAELNDPFAPSIFQGVLQTVSTGDATLLHSVMADGVTRGNPASILDSIYLTKMVIWNRIESELERDVSWEFQVTLEMIFQDATHTLFVHQAHSDELEEAQSNVAVSPPDVFSYAADLARANRELVRLEQAKTDFVSIAAHELRTPLTVLQGYIDILRENDPSILAQSGERIVRGLDGGARRMASIVDDLLDVSLMETGKLELHPESVSLESLLRTAMTQVQKEAVLRHHHYQIEIGDNIPTINADGARLHQVFRHLLTNAVKFTPDEGTISIELDRVSSEMVRIKIRDTGIGISPEDREHIFEKFYRVGEARLHSSGQTKFKGAGAGLGLAIVHGIVTKMEGEVSVFSAGYDEINCPGSTFVLKLPVKNND